MKRRSLRILSKDQGSAKKVLVNSKKLEEDPPKSVNVKVVRQQDDVDKAMAELEKIEEEKKRINVKDLQELKRKFKQTCDKVKRETQIIDQDNASKKRVGTTRSGARRGFVKRAIYTDGKFVNKGIDDSHEKFDADELQYLQKTITKFKQVNELKLEHLKYLVIDVYFDDLKAIKDGNLESDFHDRYRELHGRSRNDLIAEVKTSLFTMEQRDYLNGLLLGAFHTDENDDKGDIRHSDINYVEIVILAEITLRIVKFVHKFDSNDEALEFMLQNSREAHGIGDDDD